MNNAAPVSGSPRRLREFLLGRFLPCYLGFLLGTLVCHLLRAHTGADPVIAAALTGFAGTFLPTPRRTDKIELRAAIYAGAFAAMCAPEVIEHPGVIPMIAALGALIFIALGPFFNGLGGKLGVIAFLTTGTILIVRLFL